MKYGLHYLNESPVTIGDNGEKIFREGRKISKPVVVALPQEFKRSVYERYSQFIN